MTVQTVFDGKLTNEELGRFHRKVDEVKRRLNKGVISFDRIMDELQKMIEGEGIKPSSTTPYTTARKIFGSNLIGLEAVNRTYGLNLEEKDLPPINCSENQLKRFKKFGFQLILQIKEMKDGNPVSIRRINELAEGKASDGHKLLGSSDGRNIKTDSWYKDQPFLDQPVKLCWKVSSKREVDGTTSKNYLDQSDVLISYLGKVFNGHIPEKYKEPIKAFNTKKAEIAALLANGDWVKAGDILQSLSITGMTRESISELIYRLHLTEKATGEKLFPNIHVWTASRDSVGAFVRGGCFDSGGVYVYSRRPVFDWSGVGGSLSLEL